MTRYESKYLRIADEILMYGDYRETRNGWVKSIFTQTLHFDMSDDRFPVLTTRKMNINSVLGEYAAIIREPNNITDFQYWGCNYWNEFGDNNTGDLRIDYGNSWVDYNGVNQIEELLYNIRNHPHDRRLLINAWNPKNTYTSSLPCCHFMYQFYVDNSHLDLTVYQRSGDWMIGVPSDMIFAATFLANIASISNLKPRRINLIIGDCHIYEEHFEKVTDQMSRAILRSPHFVLAKQEEFTDFQPTDLNIIDYKHKEFIKYDLKK